MTVVGTMVCWLGFPEWEPLWRYIGASQSCSPWGMGWELFGRSQLGWACWAGQVLQFSSVQFSHSVMSNSLQPHGLRYLSITNSWSLLRLVSQWCHPTILSSVVPFSSCLQSFPASGSFPMSQLFAWGGQSIGVSASASVLPMNIQDWFPLGWTG